VSVEDMQVCTADTAGYNANYDVAGAADFGIVTGFMETGKGFPSYWTAFIVPLQGWECFILEGGTQ
jgi:hypothetical protein